MTRGWLRVRKKGKGRRLGYHWLKLTSTTRGICKRRICDNSLRTRFYEDGLPRAQEGRKEPGKGWKVGPEFPKGR